LPEVVEIAEEKTPLTSPINLLPLEALASATAVVMLIGVLLVYLLLFRKTAKLVATAKPWFYGEGKPSKTICKCRVQVKNCIAHFIIPDEIPDDFNPFSKDYNYSILLKPQVLRKADVLEVIWCEQVIQRLKPKAVCMLDKLDLTRIALDSVAQAGFVAAIVE
jgi:hypothetical protein